MRKVWIIEAGEYESRPVAVADSPEMAERVADVLGLDVLGDLLLFEEGDPLPEKIRRYSFMRDQDGYVRTVTNEYDTVVHPPGQPRVGSNLCGTVCAMDYHSPEEAEAAARAFAPAQTEPGP